MNSPPDFQLAFQRARELHDRGQLREAEELYRQLAAPGEHRETVLRALVELYMQARRPGDVIDTLVALTDEVPDSLYYYARLASTLDGLGQPDAAIGHYLRLLKRRPQLAAAHFNLALLYKKTRRYADALAAYRKAIELGIDDVQEVYSNMGVLYAAMRDADKAREMYEHALARDPDYVPALFNRAGLAEEEGDRQGAIDLYRRILSGHPRHWDSLARLAHAQRVTSADTSLVESLKRAIAETEQDPQAREGLLFALGKALDDLGSYAEALAAFRAANELGQRRNPRYDRPAVEQAFTGLINVFDRGRLASAATSTSTAAPIFICGMFRSGSTLLEQILAGHPAVTAGGELDLLPWLMARKLAPYPQRILDVSRQELGQVASEYQSRVHELFPQAANVTDKRPDNFLHLGLIKMLFPSARIVYTRRNPLDTCLSIYFQQLGDLSYATDLRDTAHYYQQHERLMAHWMSCLGENIFTVEYEELVRAPEPVLRRVVAFLGLEWDERCLAFQHTPGLVQTASLWQVREKLHTSSSGRWRNYEPFVRDLQTLFPQQRSFGTQH